MAPNPSETWTTYKVGWQLQKVIGTGLYLYPILMTYYKSFIYMFLDYNKKWDKSIKTKLLPIEGTITEDGKSLTWYDYSMFDVEHTSVADIASTDTLVLTTLTWDVNETTVWFEAGDQIMIVRKEGSTLANERRTINSTTNVNLVLNSVVAIEIWDKVIRLYYVQPQEQEITRGQSLFNYKEFKSYFQNFGRVVSFTKTELNKQYLIEKDAKTYVSTIIGHNMSILLQEFGRAVWTGQNVAVWSTVAWSKPEMLGIDTAIVEMAAKDASLILDLKDVIDDNAKIEALFEAFDLSWASWAIQNGETLSIACNQKFLRALTRLKKDQLTYNDSITEINFKIFKFNSEFSSVEFFHEPTLDKLYQGSLAYILPKSLMCMKFRDNQNLDDKANITKAKAEISFIRKINNIHDKAQFDMFFEAATVLWGLSSGAYRKIMNLK